MPITGIFLHCFLLASNPANNEMVKHQASCSMLALHINFKITYHSQKATSLHPIQRNTTSKYRTGSNCCYCIQMIDVFLRKEKRQIIQCVEHTYSTYIQKCPKSTFEYSCPPLVSIQPPTITTPHQNHVLFLEVTFLHQLL